MALRDCSPHSLLRTAALIALSAAVDLAACSYDFSPGGVQDNRLARRQIESGQIPNTDAFKVEGIFSEHDLPFTDKPHCELLLCSQTAAARHQPVDGGPEQLLVHLGFVTGQAFEGFERRPLNLSLAVDISRSMKGPPLQAVREALHTMTDQLGEDDRVSLISFNHRAQLRLKPTTMDSSGRASLRRAIDELEARGRTNIEAGLKLAFDQVVPTAGDTQVEDRVMLMTDAQPNVSGTTPDTFLGMLRSHAESEIGASIFGVGVDLGAKLAHEMSAVRGANYFYLADEAAISTVFDDEFDTIVTPVAYDLEVSLRLQEDWSFVEAYGASLDDPDEGVEIGASSLFLSKRSGGIGITLQPKGESALLEFAESIADIDLSYLPQGSSAPNEDHAPVPWSGGAAHQASFVVADDVGVFKMAALIDEYLALRAGSDFCSGTLDQQSAATIADTASMRLEEIAAKLGADTGEALLTRDAATMATLAENIRAGRSGCDEPVHN